MRLAFVSPCFHGEHYGGVQYTATQALDALENSRGIADMKVLCYGPRCTRRAQPAAHTCSHSKPGAMLRALSVRGPERVLFWHLDLLKLLPLIGAKGKRTFLFLHGIECWRVVEGPTRRLLDRIDVFLTNSDFTWKRFVEVNPQWKDAAHRTVLLGAGAPEGQIDAPGEIPAASIVGRIYKSEAYKGHAELIQAWPSVLARIPDAELWVVGGGDGIDDLRELVLAAGLGERIRFLGLVSEEEKQRLLGRSRCLVLPSRGEGFGLVYLEAMRLGRPCLASIHDAGREVIDPPQAGVAIDPADTRGLADAVAELLTPGPAWQRQSENARRRYEENFTAAHFQRRLLDAVLEGAAG